MRHALAVTGRYASAAFDLDFFDSEESAVYDPSIPRSERRWSVKGQRQGDRPLPTPSASPAPAGH